jgi:tRNA (guanine26-N2/guanine27-N2)-dimethyltransferase
VFKIFLNDSNHNAIEIAKINAEINQIKDKCTFFNDDANHFLISSRNNGNLFNVIDVDPFGTPAPFLEDIVKTIMGGGLISVTATDAPVLCGIHPLVALRKYYGRSLHVEYCHEVGIRLLFSALAFAASRYDRGIKPLFCHLTRHYFRIYAQVSTGAEEAKASIGKIGYINHCTNCNERNTSDTPLDKCKVCGGKLSYAGPLWVGKIFDLEFLKKMIQVANEKGFQRYLKMLNMSVEEIDSPPTYFLISMICDRLQIRTPSIVKIIEKLGEYGFTSSRTMLNNRAIKTNAPSKVVNEVLISLSHVRQADQV